jgi:hypothetical protein
MSEILKRNFEPGRLLLVATLLMSITLISQLYVISESVDLSNGIQLNNIDICLTASYIFTALSMVIVISEFFQVKTKIKGLLALSNLINLELNPMTVQPDDITDPRLMSKLEIQKISEKELDEESDFEKLLEDELDDSESTEEETLKKTGTSKVKVDETEALKPLIEGDELQGVFDEIEEESEMDRLLSESEVIATLAELEELVEELRHKKVAVIAK